ncbi:hypothetical protein [Asticcacaulis endophyticus]|uniref:Uncharacterized protein n=1 Tax=Asticcacaulis endophyticus TaxID=1395890 RepID=A0A918UX20_9CAUL|nr:hypothetical protein [Asticcacaulis endophyticus]GGZ39258.1 hypothetical protein GCM10011273_27110 [Asticcacaulis endophyticus]
MTYQKFGLGRHRPPGVWVETTLAESVAGIPHRLPYVRSWLKAVKRAERQGLYYGLELIPEPLNSHDENAIQVVGLVERNWPFMAPVIESYHIGYVPAFTAAELQTDIISQGLRLGGELYSIYIEVTGHIDVKFVALAPPGYEYTERIEKRG